MSVPTKERGLPNLSHINQGTTSGQVVKMGEGESPLRPAVTTNTVGGMVSSKWVGVAAKMTML